MKSIRNRYAMIDYSDGIQSADALTIAQMHAYQQGVSDMAHILQARVRFPDKACLDAYWQVDLPRKTLTRYRYLINREDGEVWWHGEVMIVNDHWDLLADAFPGC